MNLSCLLALNDGTVFHRFPSNPFQPGKVRRLSYLVSVKPLNSRPVQPVLETGPEARRQDRRSTCAERVEAMVLRTILGLLLLASIGCGFGVQHIAHVREKAALCQQLRHAELELHKLSQAYRSLESSVASQMPQDTGGPDFSICFPANPEAGVPAWLPRQPTAAIPVAVTPVAAKHPVPKSVKRN